MVRSLVHHSAQAIINHNKTTIMEKHRLHLFLLISFFTFSIILPTLMAHNDASSIEGELGSKPYNGPCIATNPIDQCWRCNKNWIRDRKKLASCSQGFGHNAIGGRDGPFYTVFDPSDNDVVNPKPGTLRHAVIQKGPLWIIFSGSMIISLKQELMMQSDKTIDGRGANVHIANGAGITIQNARNIIIHNLHIHHISPASGGMIRDSVDHFGFRDTTDGDAINIYQSTTIWLDHLSMSHARDGLIDVIAGSTDITISNCHFTDHVKVLLLGASDEDLRDKRMHVTVAYNHFGKRLGQRMPRCRWGFFHVINNEYTHWQKYALGGSKGATIISQGNRFIAPANPNFKEVTHRMNARPNEWKQWTWRSEGDVMMNGAFMVESGNPNWARDYHDYQLIKPLPATQVGNITKFSGSLGCRDNFPC